jgi:ATP-dependent DNA ligase
MVLLRKYSVSCRSGFVEPCLPSRAPRPPSGRLWVHEIKHDGFRLLVRKEGSQVRCFTRAGHDWADRFPGIVDAAQRLKASSFLIDGEAIVCRENGLSDFEALRVGRCAHEVMLAAFDLIELQTDDLRDEPLVRRKHLLAKVLAGSSDAIAFNEHFSHQGDVVFEHACRMGLEGIVSKRLDAPYRSGLSKVWLKSKNPLSAAVRREREGDWR